MLSPCSKMASASKKRPLKQQSAASGTKPPAAENDGRKQIAPPLTVRACCAALFARRCAGQTCRSRPRNLAAFAGFLRRRRPVHLKSGPLNAFIQIISPRRAPQSELAATRATSIRQIESRRHVHLSTRLRQLRRRRRVQLRNLHFRRTNLRRPPQRDSAPAERWPPPPPPPNRIETKWEI